MNDGRLTIDYSRILADQIAQITREYLPNEVSIGDSERYGKWRSATVQACSTMLAHMQALIDEAFQLKITASTLQSPIYIRDFPKEGGK